MTKIREFITTLTTQLRAVCDNQHAAEFEAWLVMEHVSGKSKAQLLAAESVDLSRAQQQQLNDMLTQRIEHKKPLNYLLGWVPFCDLKIIVESPILIPRPETEELVTWLLEQLQPVRDQGLRILDLCTGSGCIALALAKHLPKAQIVGIDINPQAVALANKNKEHNRIHNAEFIESDLYQKLDPNKPFDLIVSNPPYISHAEYQQLSSQIKQWEDRNALVADNEGLLFYERIARAARSYLKHNSTVVKHRIPCIVVELGTSPKAVQKIFADNGFGTVSVHRDLQGVERWVGVYLTVKTD